MNALSLLKALQRKTEVVEVEGMGKFTVSGLTVGEFLDASQHSEDQDMFFAKAIAYGMRDGKGNKMFKPEHAAELSKTSNVNFIVTLGSKILELSQPTIADEKDAKK